MATDILIIGGGVIGLSCAYFLAKSAPELTITLLDSYLISAGNAGQASFAAAGMLAPYAEAHADGPLVRLGIASLCRYPDFVDALNADAGIFDPSRLSINGEGMLRIAVDEDEARNIDNFTDWQTRSYGADLTRLSGQEACSLEPALTPAVLGAVLSLRERSVDPRKLTLTLARAVSTLGVEVIPSSQIVEARSVADGYAVQSASGEAVTCGTLIVAGGVWTTTVGHMLGVAIPVAPVKGQICAVRPVSAADQSLRYTIYGSKCYLVPRPEGKIVVGATEEPGAGFDIGIRGNDIDCLRTNAATLVPSLQGASLEDAPWAGLRPRSPDGLPILGVSRGHRNLHFATGHYRNGILLAPITGEIIAHEILHDAPHPLLAPEFSPDRFSRS